MNFLDFMMNTYEEDVHEPIVDAEDMPGTDRRRGRPRKERIPFLPQANKPSKCRVQRNSGHEMLPRFIGRWFPRNNNAGGDNELHGACILLLFQPWRNLTELKKQDQTFAQSLTHFLATATEKQVDIIENIQYYHDCWDVAQKRRDAFCQGKFFKLFDYERQSIQIMDNTESEEIEEIEECPEPPQPMTAIDPMTEIIDEHRIEEARLKQRNE